MTYIIAGRLQRQDQVELAITELLAAGFPRDGMRQGGILPAIIGTLYTVWAAPKLLPARKTLAEDLGGDGGVILVTPEGHAIFSFNTTGMYRGRATSGGVNEVAIFGGAFSVFVETP